MKRFLTTILISALLLTFTACSNETSDISVVTSSSVLKSTESSTNSSINNDESSNNKISKENSENISDIKFSENSNTSHKNESSVQQISESLKENSSTTGNTNTSSSSSSYSENTTVSKPCNSSSSSTSSKPSDYTSSENNSSSSISSSKPSHSHSYSSKTIKATCTSGGYTVHTCSCGANYTDSYTDATGHKWSDWKTVKKATESSEGKKEHICTICNKVESKIIDKIKIQNKYDDVATSNDAKLISERTLYYINQYRSKKASMLPNMTAYAEYRAKQLTTNFAHDPQDENAAATALKYGDKHQESIYDPKTNTVKYLDNYVYRASCGEAIGQGYGYTINDVAKCLADGVYNSADHWRYVGYPDNIYISIGVCYKNGLWYCCICTSSTNKYG